MVACGSGGQRIGKEGEGGVCDGGKRASGRTGERDERRIGLRNRFKE